MIEITCKLLETFQKKVRFRQKVIEMISKILKKFKKIFKNENYFIFYKIFW